ncbi:hypothetical protein OS175_03100 [Marinicella sp. S1101]|uniref:hypothetical protein n=1 Tax=Marinicella marina TaxID=2996016 RepID=UPI002260F2D8|nr:hypothetical protein [Marinicella marina]MCX7552855.1 hypothetical protein [Marinicella marina]MDJ1139836.1 hypothetical protein [Marinicella marina]
MAKKAVVFTPLRILLIVSIIIFNLLGVFTMINAEASWAEFVGVLSVVFIMLFVFVILLEWTWLHHRGKLVEDAKIRSQYQLAKWIYAVLFVIGFVISYVVLS